MVAQRTENDSPPNGNAISVTFAGDNVQLAGQIDYPHHKKPDAGYPLIFVIQHATCVGRKGYSHIARIGNAVNAAVFRWDKRGTGRSGSAAGGSIAIDTMKAYQAAIKQSAVDRSRVVIFAQNEGSLLLADILPAINDIAPPIGVILAGNMLDETRILTINAPLHIVISKNDWNAWQIYAEKAADIHAEHYNTAASFYVATNTNRMLLYKSGGMFHHGAETSIKHWLKHTCQIS